MLGGNEYILKQLVGTHMHLNNCSLGTKSNLLLPDSENREIFHNVFFGEFDSLL